MDKNTLSNYGWIVTCVLALAVMIALATPFGTYVKDAVWSTTEGLFDVQESAFDVLGIDLNNDTADDIGTVGSDKTITLRGSKVADGTYTLKYENNGTPLTGYADICSLTITDGADASYTSLIAENCAPVGATVIGVYDSTDARVGEISLGSLKPKLGTKLYSFGAISDVHIKAENEEPSNHFKDALTYFTDVESVDFICISGDLVDKSTETYYTKYKNIVDNYAGSTPVYAIAGNHDTDEYGNDMENSIAVYTGHPLYYSVTIKDDVFIFLGTKDISPKQMADGELQWFYETLEENRNKRCFVFTHSFSSNDAGNPLNVQDTNILWNGYEGQSYESLRSHYSNITVFTGHSHFEFATQCLDESANYTNDFGYNSIHIPSLACPRNLNADNSYSNNWDESEGYVVDVYESGIVLYGRDFIGGDFLPIATYYIQTPITSIEKETYVDPGGTIITDSTKNGVYLDIDGEIRYYVNGLAKSAGLVQDSEGNYYYINSSKKAVKSCNYVISNDNGLGFSNTTQKFDESGKMIIKNGLCFDEDGEIRYYVNGVAKASAGLVQDGEGNYYYINSSKKAVKSCNYLISKDNGLGFAGTYQDFDENGRMIIK